MLDVEQLECGDGWVDLIQNLASELDMIVRGWTLVQAKEKFGGLRFYISAPQEWTSSEMIEARKLISAAESESYEICEWCGAPGSVRNERWIRTLCDTDYATLLQNRAK